MGDLLDGVTVLDLSTVGPGARCTAALRDLGAELVKVIAPKGAGRVEVEPWAYGGPIGVRSVELDLKDPDGVAEFLRLVTLADAVVESFRPGVADRLGIGYEACRNANPRVVYAAVTGYGQDGPYAGWAGHDLNYLAVGGFLATQGRRRDGGPALPGVTLADAAGGGLHAGLSIAAALFRRERTGKGTYLDVSTTEGVLHLMSMFVDEWLATGKETKPGNSLLTGQYACYDVYECADGRWVAVGAIESRFFGNLCEALGITEVAELQYRDDRQDEVRTALARAFLAKGRDEWVAELAPKDTCVAPVLDIPEVPENAHFAARRAFDEVLGGHGEVRRVGRVLAGGNREAGR